MPGLCNPEVPAGNPGIQCLNEMLHLGEVTVQRIVEDLLDHRSADDHIFTHVMDGEARQQAARADERRRAGRSVGPLDGIPVAIKDCFDVAGAPTTNGSIVDATTFPARRDAGIVLALKREGIVTVGKTNQSELAFSGLGTNPHFGTPSNPLSTDEPLVTGGSSSGSAAAVATGQVPLALGTDTSGSVRVPAAFCGVVGYKATEGRFPRDGIRPLSNSLDSIGLIARSVADIQLTLAALGAPTPTHAGQEVHTVRLVVPDDEVVTDCEPETRAWFDRQVRRIEHHTDVLVERRSLPVLRVAQELMDDQGTLVAAEANAAYGHYLDGPSERLLDPAIARRLRAATTIGRAELVRARMPAMRRQLLRDLDGALLICPTVRHRPPTIAKVTESGSEFDLVNARTLRTTMLLSYLGMPGVSLPLGDGHHQGIGLLISAPWGMDEQALRTAAEIDRLEN